MDNEAALLREFRNVAEVFISYKHIEPDKSLAAALADAIRSRHQVFIDTQIPLGKEWGDVIQDNLGGADADYRPTNRGRLHPADFCALHP